MFKLGSHNSRKDKIAKKSAENIHRTAAKVIKLNKSIISGVSSRKGLRPELR